MAINWNRPYGQISPGWRGASYEQVGTDGVTRYYNSSGYEVDIRTGATLEGPEKPQQPRASVPETKSVAERARDLLDEKDKPPFNKFAMRAAALIGGENPPSTKSEIVAALEALAAPSDKPEPEPQPEPGAGAGTDDDGPAPLVGDERVNLKAWATGKAKYVFSDVAAAIREAYAIEVMSAADALEALTNMGLIAAKPEPVAAQAKPDPELEADEAEEAAMAAEVRAEAEAAERALEAERQAALKAEVEEAARIEAEAEAEAKAGNEAVAASNDESPAPGKARIPDKAAPQPKPEKQKKVG